MSQRRNDRKFISKPIYPGGGEAMQAFISQNLQYPPEALEARVEGDVKIAYTIDSRGRVKDSKVLEKLGHGCDEEAQRVVELLRFNLPGNHGRKILFHQQIIIHFRLPAQQAAPAPNPTNSYQYTIISTQKPQKPPSEKPANSYEYTIQYNQP
jgi:TonB family protein